MFEETENPPAGGEKVEPREELSVEPPKPEEPPIEEKPEPEVRRGLEDIFAETESKAMPKLVPEEAETRARELAKSAPRVRIPIKRILISLLTLIVIAGLVYGGWLVYKRVIEPALEKQGAEEEIKVEEKSGLTPEEPAERPSLPLDTDSDGLPDKEEEILGTGINVVDTDRDGLFDGEEVKIYRTDPLKADSDGDGYPDGTEVKNGYDPLDPTPGARLFNLGEEIEKIK